MAIIATAKEFQSKFSALTKQKTKIMTPREISVEMVKVELWLDTARKQLAGFVEPDRRKRTEFSVFRICYHLISI